MSNQAPAIEHILYFDCFSGISGDMVLGAFLDLGLEPEALWGTLQQLELNGYTSHCQRILKNHLVGTQVKFQVSAPQPHRTYLDIRVLIERANLPDNVKDLSGRIFQLLAEAESLVHEQPLEQVHFHEVGGVDSILDIVGAAYCLHSLNISTVYASPLPMGQGMIASAHGQLPNPAPATALLLQGVPQYGTDVRAELVTPTGAAILKGMSACFDPLPTFTPEKIGYGAGSRDLPSQPNLLRLVLGRSSLPVGRSGRVLVLETNLDDMIPEWYEHLMNALFKAGALDVAYFPMQMKKNRPGIGLTVVAPLEYREAILGVLFAESTTLGVRLLEMERVAVNRWLETIDTPYGPLQVKVAEIAGHRRVLPEYEACRELALKHNLPLLEVYRLIKV